jgi:hypothetical protein
MRNPLSIRWLAASAAIAAAATACGGGGGDDDGDDDDDPIDAAVVAPDAETPAPDAGDGTSATATIGAAGGTITLGPVSISFPAGAFSADTEVTLSRETSFFLAPNGVPDGHCLYSDLFEVTPARSFEGSLPTLTIDLPAGAPSLAELHVALGLDGQFSGRGGTREGDVVTGQVSQLGRLFYGRMFANSPASPSSGSPGAVVFLGGPFGGLTGLGFRPVAGGAETAATIDFGGEGLDVTVPSVAAGSYALALHHDDWPCGDVPGTFTVTGAP